MEINISYREKLGAVPLLLSSPVIYSLAIPLLLLDIWMSIYQAVCFPLYGLTQVERNKYIHDQRYKLRYLNGLEKLNCYYCGYANGVIMYAQAIARETEKMWCPIKNKKIPGVVEPAHRKAFAEYGNKEELLEYVAEKSPVKPHKK